MKNGIFRILVIPFYSAIITLVSMTYTVVKKLFLLKFAISKKNLNIHTHTYIYREREREMYEIMNAIKVDYIIFAFSLFFG